MGHMEGLTGPRTGQYARLFGVSSWADLDKANTTNTINIQEAMRKVPIGGKYSPYNENRSMEVWMNVWNRI